MSDQEYSMIDVMLTALKYSKGHWTPDEVLEFGFMLEELHLSDEYEDGKPNLVSLKGGKSEAEETT